MGADGSEEKVLCRTERMHPEYDWIPTWEKLRLPIFSSKIVSFLWKMLHDLLTTEERLHNTLGNIPDKCSHGCEDFSVANQIHCFFNCSLTYDIGQWLLKIVRIFGPSSESDILKLNVPNNQALVWIILSAMLTSVRV